MTNPPAPFRIARTVSWGDCDPALMIYTPRVFEYASEALEAFYRAIIGVTWFDLNWTMQMGAPTVRAECDYIRALKPDMDVTIEIRVTRLGTSSVTYVMTCRDVEKGEDYFRVTYVTAYIQRSDFKSTPIPANFRERLVAYRAACGDKE